jgi:hypothetical protein
MPEWSTGTDLGRLCQGVSDTKTFRREGLWEQAPFFSIVSETAPNGKPIVLSFGPEGPLDVSLNPRTDLKKIPISLSSASKSSMAGVAPDDLITSHRSRRFVKVKDLPLHLGCLCLLFRKKYTTGTQTLRRRIYCKLYQDSELRD